VDSIRGNWLLINCAFFGGLKILPKLGKLSLGGIRGLRKEGVLEVTNIGFSLEFVDGRGAGFWLRLKLRQVNLGRQGGSKVTKEGLGLIRNFLKEGFYVG